MNIFLLFLAMMAVIWVGMMVSIWFAVRKAVRKDESQIQELEARLALAEAVIDSADYYLTTDCQEIHVLVRLIAAYRAEVKS